MTAAEAATVQPVFGRVLTAMVTPMTADGSLDLAAAGKLAAHLVDDLGNDGLVINGTTGEAPTTSDDEKRLLLREVVAAVGDRASVVAGVGTNDTRHTIKLANEAEVAGADGLLVVTPYYSRPPVTALEDHFLSVAEAARIPIMLYDIPHRSGIPIPEASLIKLADHPRIVAVKDAKGDLVSSATVIAQTTLQYYAGDDALLLPLLALGGVGVVGTSTHFTAPQAHAIIDAFLAGDTQAAVAVSQAVLPVFRGVFATQGTMMVKAALAERGMPVGGCRPPMGVVPPEMLASFMKKLDFLR
ncbi:MAG: 4-hydroxy-tetrahydrodipicolinate synthase [Arachnia propionica]|nr:MAG: 4-hydroxy-tetrahydrodipicolinate synthase [Arachnia propionica]